MQTITKAIYTAQELNAQVKQKVKKIDTDYSGMIAGGLIFAIALTVFILSTLGIIHH
ncbi:MAG: hypothetical protein IID03_12075 [Candidatus Dadabacteria bacterium]|nr:hypothetical protein [Candidatus Dadabacteria bacterium]